MVGSNSRTTAHRIMTVWKPYKAQFVTKKKTSKIELTCKTLTSMLKDNDIKESFFFFDETTFYLQDLVNKHNIRYRCEINPRITIESIMKSPKV